MSHFYGSLEVDPWSAASSKRCGQAFLESYGKLHDELREQAPADQRPARKGQLCWPIKPKHHLFQHLVEQQLEELGNPRAYWTYVDESLMGAIAMMAAATPDPRSVAQQVLEKLVLCEAIAL